MDRSPKPSIGHSGRKNHEQYHGGLKTVSHLKVAFTQTFSIDLISYQPLPGCGHIPVWSLHPGQPLKHNSREPRNSDPQNSDSSPLPLQPRSHFCPSHTQPLAIPNTSVESRPPCEHDPALAFLLPLHSLSAMPTFEGWLPDPFEVVHIELSSDISESRPDGTCIPIWYGVSFRSVPFEASFSVTLSGSQREAFLIFPKMSNAASPPAEPGVYLSANYVDNFQEVLKPYGIERIYDPVNFFQNWGRIHHGSCGYDSQPMRCLKQRWLLKYSSISSS